MGPKAPDRQTTEKLVLSPVIATCTIHQSRTFAAICDKLLSKLLSGEIHMGQAERGAEEVA